MTYFCKRVLNVISIIGKQHYILLVYLILLIIKILIDLTVSECIYYYCSFNELRGFQLGLYPEIQ